MQARLWLLSKRILGGEWAFEVYLALVTLFASKDTFEVADVRRLCSADLKAPTLSKQLSALVLFGLLRRGGRVGEYEKVEDAFWDGIETIVRAWDTKPPTSALEQKP